MLDKRIIKEVLDIPLSLGADYSEIYMENSNTYRTKATGKELTDLQLNNEYGIGLRVFYGLVVLYAYTNDLDEDNLKQLAKNLCLGRETKRQVSLEPFIEEEKSNITPIKIKHEDYDNKVPSLCLEANRYMQEYSEEIIQTVAMMYENSKTVLIATSDGKYVTDERCHLRLSVQAVAKRGEVIQTGMNNYGFNSGYEIFNDFDLKDFATNVSRMAVLMLSAQEIKGQEMPVIIHNGFGGVIFHEACGHSLEASSVARNTSVFSGMQGQQIASPLVNAYDDGTILSAWGSLNVDDEGIKTRKNQLIEKGCLKGYMTDLINAKMMGTNPTGSSRRESYKYMPTSRMTNTYIANGESSFEEIIANTPYALFAKTMGGGSVNPMTGDFNFAVLEGYMVINGKIANPVKGATLVGNGRDVLKKVDMVGNNQTFGHGFCGAQSGSIPTNVGQPTIRLSKMIVGGKGE